MSFLLFSVFVSIVLSSVVNCCPPQERIAPACICKDLGDGPMMMCSNMMSADELIAPIKATDTMKMFSLVIVDSTLLYIPSKLFKNTFFEKIRFANSRIMALSDSDLAFEGLEDHLEEIRASDAHYITQWDWSQLRNLRKISTIDIHLISMYSIEQQFPSLESLQWLSISKAEISFIHPKAFRGLAHLKMLILKENEITEMSRSMLPNPAKELFLIDLSDNKLSSFPPNMFTNMPNLKELDLNNNHFVTLDEDTFRWPFENLASLMFKGNAFRCDCRLRWLVGTKKPSTFEAICNLPDSLNGVSLENLASSSLWCI